GHRGYLADRPDRDRGRPADPATEGRGRATVHPGRVTRRGRPPAPSATPTSNRGEVTDGRGVHVLLEESPQPVAACPVRARRRDLHPRRAVHDVREGPPVRGP